jgi:molybdate/tungstate transport system permease protein
MVTFQVSCLTMLRSLRSESLLATALGVLSLFVVILLIPMVSIFVFFKPYVVDEILSSPGLATEVKSALITTFEASLVSTGILTLLGVPSAYFLARKDFKGKSVVEGLLDVPLAVPHTVAGIMVLTGFGRRGLLGPFTSSIGLRVSDSFWGVVAAMMFVSSPLIVDTAKAGFYSVNPSLEAVSRSLGAGPWTTFFKITLPLSWRSIVAGIILSWARALSEVGSLLVVAYFPKTINIVILEFLDEFGLPYAIAVAVPFLLMTLTLFVLLRILVGHRFLVYT